MPTVGSEPEQPLTTDEEAAAPARSGQRPTPDSTACARSRLGLADMPGGALVGTVVHGILEHGRLRRARPRRREVAAALERQVAWRNVDLGSRDAVVAGLCAAIESPLGPLVGERGSATSHD